MITRAQALAMFESDDVIALGMEADMVRKALHPEPIVSYSLQEDSGGASNESIVAKADSRNALIDALDNLRNLQEETKAFLAFIPPFRGTAVEYLKMVAISRIYLDNIPHIQAPPEIAGAKVCQIALKFGANDLGVIPSVAEEDARRLIRDAGFVPKQRDALFRMLFLY